MATIKQINQTLEESNSLKMVAQAYSEISAVKLQKIRTGIEKNRLFIAEIAQIYHMVQISSTAHHILPKTKKLTSLSMIITSNDRFYGSLENDLTRFYLINTAKIKTDRLIIGKTAVDQLHGMNYFHQFKTMILKNDIPSPEELHQLGVLISSYQRVLVYHTHFKSVLIQKPTVQDITQSATATISAQEDRKLDFIFEPEVDKMLDFFNDQIMMLILEQTFLEAELARTAARLISMDQAQGNADDFIKQQKRLLAGAKRATDNSYLLETIASLANSKKHHYGKR